MLDLDHFKVLNDTHGHQMGDEVLREVAAALSAHCREMDIPARYGGEEFTVILPNCGIEEAAASATRLWSSVCDRPLFVPLTVSAGHATFPDNARTGKDLVFAADQALYQAKRAGRNRVMGCTRMLPRTRLGVVASEAG
jgi:diguanylate cyclase (GGDEF)-like protein